MQNVSLPSPQEAGVQGGAVTSRLWRWAVRHGASLADAGLVLALLFGSTLLAWEVEIFGDWSWHDVRPKTIDLDERLLLLAILTAGLLFFASRRFFELRHVARFRADIQGNMRLLAFEDVLTGLQNRRRFDDALAAAAAALPGADACHAVFMIDLNGFKRVNDRHGHMVGDAVLTVVAQRLMGAVKAGDLVCRFGGDEFAILALHLSGAAAAASIALRVIECLGPPVRAGGLSHQVGAGIGVALMPRDAATPAEAVRKADVALYRAKAEKVSCVRFFEKEMDRQLHERTRLMEDLRAAILHDEIRPRFLPTVDLRSQEILGFEAVPGWRHLDRGDLPPHEFMPLAEEAGLAGELALRLLLQSCEAAARWPATVGLSIDVLPVQLADAGLPDRVAEILEQTGLPPGRLEFEIAESVLVRDLTNAQATLGRLRSRGVRIALDHFGSGYSSLYHLRTLKLDRVKIDRGFIASMGSQPESREVVNALVGLGRGLGLQVAAEGVGTAAQQAALVQSGCEQGQGAIYSDALSGEEVSALLRTGMVGPAQMRPPRPAAPQIAEG